MDILHQIRAARAANNKRAHAPAGLFLDRHGAWFHDGDAVEHAGLEAMLHRCIARDAVLGLVVKAGPAASPSGGHIGEMLPLRCEDAPYTAQLETDDEGAAWLVLSDGTREPLAGRTLYTDSDHVLRCAVKNDVFWARLSRSAHQLLWEHIDDDGQLRFGAAVCRIAPVPLALRYSDAPNLCGTAEPLVR